MQKAWEKEETKKRKAEDQLRKQEEKKRQQELERGEKRGTGAEENRWQPEGEDTWRGVDLGNEIEKRRRVGYDTFVQVPSPDPPPPPCPRPRPTKKLLPMATPMPDIPLDNGFVPVWFTVVTPMSTSLLPSIYSPPPSTPHPQPHLMRWLPPMDGQHDYVVPPFNTPFYDELMPAQYQTHALPITTPAPPPIYPYPPAIRPPSSGFVGPSVALNTPHQVGYLQCFGHPLPPHICDNLLPTPYEPVFPDYNGFHNVYPYLCELLHAP